jgi:hypothetical protein
MKKYAPFLSLQLARFGALTIPQMIGLCQGSCQKSTLYRTIGQWTKQGLLRRITHPVKSIIAYAATPALYALVYGSEHQRRIGIRETELSHSLFFSDVMIELSQYANVSGLASEYEIEPEEARQFCHGRNPDGIIQLTNEGSSFEFAVEVETSRKSTEKMERILAAYKSTFFRNMRCVGTIIVAEDPSILARYQKQIAELPAEIEERILVVNLQGLRALKTDLFGERLTQPGQSLELIRNSSQGTIHYTPLITKEFRPTQAPNEGA